MYKLNGSVRETSARKLHVIKAQNYFERILIGNSTGADFARAINRSIRANCYVPGARAPLKARGW